MRVSINSNDLDPNEIKKTDLYKAARQFQRSPAKHKKDYENRFFEELAGYFHGYNLETVPDGGKVECEVILGLAGFKPDQIEYWWKEFVEWRDGEEGSED